MLRRRLVPLLAVALAGLLMVPATLAAAPLFPPGLRVGLEPAADLRPSTRFPGFEDIDRNVMVTMIDLPAAAYEEIAVAIAKDAGVSGAKRENFQFAGGKGVLVSGAAQDKGLSLRRWFLVAAPSGKGPADVTTLIRVEVPEAARATYTDAAVRRMLSTVNFRQVPLEELLGLLPFKLTDMAGFRVAKVLPGSVMVTEGPSDDIATQPYAIVSAGRGAPRNEDRGRFARDVLAVAPVSGLTVTSADSMRINGAAGYELRATAENRQGEAITLVQWIRFGGDGFLGIVGVARSEDWNRMFNRFRALRDGVDIR